MNKYISLELFPKDADISTPDTTIELDPRSDLKGTSLTWGETPLVTNPEQQEVFRLLYDRITYNVPIDTPEEVQDFVISHFMSRFYRRQARNEQSFVDRSVEDLNVLDSEILSCLDLAFIGGASPVELLQLRHAIGMPSIELSRFTHPYGLGMETLDEMRLAVAYAIEQMDGVLCDRADCTTYGIDSSHTMSNSGCQVDFVKLGLLDATLNGEDECMEMLESSRQRESATLSGVLMKRKRILAVLPDGTEIIERSSFILRIDKESELDQIIARKMRNIVIDGNPNWENEMADACNLSTLMSQLLLEKRFDIAIPLSTTVYAHNLARENEAKAINKAKEEDALARSRAIMDSYGYEYEHITPVSF